MDFKINETRDKKVTTRFTATEKGLMEQYALARKLSVSDFIRFCVDNEINGNTHNKK